MPHPSIAELVSLEGRVAVVTGGGRGIGRATAARLVEAGALVVVADRDERAAADVASELGCTGLRADATSAEDHAAVVRTASELGPLGVWVNNAGVLPGVGEPDREAWNHMLDLDLTSVFLGCSAAAGAMASGVIVNVASTTGLRGYPGMAHYVAAKHGVVGLTKALAADLAPDIRVLGVAPTFVDTEGMTAKRRAIVAGGGLDPAVSVIDRIPLARLAHPDDVARVVLFAVSGLAAYLTGHTIPVDGGRMAVEV